MLTCDADVSKLHASSDSSVALIRAAHGDAELAATPIPSLRSLAPHPEAREKGELINAKTDQRAHTCIFTAARALTVSWIVRLAAEQNILGCGALPNYQNVAHS